MKILILLYLLIYTTMTNNIYDISIEGIDGKTIELSEYKGKKILIVNVASACGYTPQYKQLQELHENFGDKIVVLGVPSNDFGSQEPGTEAEIVEFCSSKFGVTFPMTEKIKVKGVDKHALYQWLTDKSKNGQLDTEVRWNFHKFLIDENGELYKELPSNVTPLDEEILNWVNG